MLIINNRFLSLYDYKIIASRKPTVITNLLSPFPSLIEWVCGGHYIYYELLFVSFFWTSFHSLSSPSFGGFWTGFYVPDPSELTFANTLLLSNAAISLGNAFIKPNV